jgi:DNA repair photolyase
MDWFMDGIARGSFEVVNPYNRRTRHVPATPDSVHAIVFWSKNFKPFIAGRYAERLAKKGYHLFFNFTINSEFSILEPGVPPLTDRLFQLGYICEHFDVRAVHWRFDPICFYKSGDGKIRNNLDDFLRIADKASELGVQRCITSFMDFYPKIKRRTAGRSDVTFVDVAMDEKIKILRDMRQKLDTRHIALQTCCEKEVLDALPMDAHVNPGACIPNDLIMDIYGGVVSVKQDAGQRIKAGCGCKESIDIGSYHLHPCYHNCLFCYANPTSDKKIQIFQPSKSFVETI